MPFIVLLRNISPLPLCIFPFSRPGRKPVYIPRCPSLEVSQSLISLYKCLRTIRPLSLGPPPAPRNMMHTLRPDNTLPDNTPSVPAHKVTFILLHKVRLHEISHALLIKFRNISQFIAPEAILAMCHPRTYLHHIHLHIFAGTQATNRRPKCHKYQRTVCLPSTMARLLWHMI